MFALLVRTMSRPVFWCLCLLLATLLEMHFTSGVRLKRGATARNCDDACKRAIGICPPPNRYPYMMMCVPNCKRDSNCSNGLKCCEGRCGKMCMSPLSKYVLYNSVHFVAIMLTINFKLIMETTINVCYYLRVNDVSDSCVFVSVNQTRYNIKEMLTFRSLKIGEPGYSSFLFFFLLLLSVGGCLIRGHYHEEGRCMIVNIYIHNDAL